MKPRVIGVRHHSPACAGLVARVLEEVKPDFVLIEGPADFNERIPELLLDHRTPVALYTYTRGGWASWAPFCDYSPEWVALRAGSALGARVMFMDLPGWSRAFAEVENRYSDRQGADVTALARKLGFDDQDRLWDSLFEQPRDDLEEALRTYFHALREGLGEVEPQDQEREQFMAGCLTWAAQQGSVVAVCGGYHQPFLESASASGADWPELPKPPGEVGTYLIPFSFPRLDSFRGYASGMPSPEYHQKVFTMGLDAAAQSSLSEAAVRLRAKKQAISSADLIGAWTTARALQRMRGHAGIARTDLLDGMAASLVKDALPVELPWSQRGVLPAGSDPVLVELVAAFCGDREGRLDATTPLPPLVADVRATLERLKLVIPSKFKLRILDEREKSAALHRLLLLEIPGFERTGGPSRATEGILEEEWQLEKLFETDPALIEAAHYGPDLESATVAKLEAVLIAKPGAAELAQLISAAVFAKLDVLQQRTVQMMVAAIHREAHFAELGQATRILLELWRHDRLLGSAGRDDLGACLSACFRRGLWLFEGLLGDEPGAVQALAALRDVDLYGKPLDLDRELALDLMDRAAAESARATPLRGAALGYTWSVRAPEAGQVARLTGGLPAPQAADFLVGLLGLAKEAVLQSDELVRELDQWVQSWHPDEFLGALPPMRLAFAALTPMEKDGLGRQLAALYGKEIGKSWLKLEVPAEVVAQGMQLESRLRQWKDKVGLP